MVFTHNELLHAGSINTSAQTRYFISAYVQRIGLPHRDRFDVAVVEAIYLAAQRPPHAAPVWIRCKLR